MFCVLILYMTSGTYSLNSISNDRFLVNFLLAILFSFRAFTGHLRRESYRRNIFRISVFSRRGLVGSVFAY